MKKTKVLIFFLILVLLLAGSSAAFRVYADHVGYEVSDRTRNLVGLQQEPENTIDVIVVGDSESYTSVASPQMWQEKGITSYNCGQTGQKLSEAYYTLKEVFKTQSPKVVLLETNMIFRYKGLKNEVKTTMAEIGYYIFPVFRYHNLWKKTLKEPDGDNYFGYKGFDIRPIVDPYTGGDYMKETDKAKAVHGFDKIFLNKILKLCEKNGVQVVLYSAPSPKNYNYEKHNALSEIAEEKSISYVDFNLKLEELGIDWAQDSLDKGDHLNIYGAQKVTSYLSNMLSEQYGLTDHRGDENYQAWDTFAENYEHDLAIR